jgi:hypothetical protein
MALEKLIVTRVFYCQYFTKGEPMPRKSPKTGVQAVARTPVFGLFQDIL